MALVHVCGSGRVARVHVACDSGSMLRVEAPVFVPTVSTTSPLSNQLAAVATEKGSLLSTAV